MSGDEKELSDLERSLAELRPAPAGFDRDRVMFEAGRATYGRRRLLWPATTGMMTAVAACLGLFIVMRPTPEPTVRVVYVERTTVEPPAAAPSPPQSPAPSRESVKPTPTPDTLAYWRLQEIAVRHGIDALPELQTSAGPMPAPNAATTSVWQHHGLSGAASAFYHAGVD